MVILTGCEKQKEIKPKAVFSTDFTLEYNTMQIKGELERDKNGEIKVEISKPDKLKGLSFFTRGEKIYIKFKGIQTCVEKESLPNGASPVLIKEVFTVILSGEMPEFKRSENVYKGEVNTTEGKANITLDTNGSLKRIEIKNHGFIIKFN